MLEGLYLLAGLDDDVSSLLDALALNVFEGLVNGRVQWLQRWLVYITLWETFESLLLLSVSIHVGECGLLDGRLVATLSHQVLQQAHEVLIVGSECNGDTLVLLLLLGPLLFECVRQLMRHIVLKVLWQFG